MTKALKLHIDRSEGDVRLFGSCDVTVTPQGKFRTRLPQHIAESMEAVGISLDKSSHSKHSGWFESDTFDDLHKQVDEAISVYFDRKELFNGIVIRTCLRVNGRFVYSGKDVAPHRDLIEDGKWFDDQHRIGDNDSYVEFLAIPMRKVVSVFPNGKTVTKYDKIVTKPEDGHLHWLNSIAVPYLGGKCMVDLEPTHENLVNLVGFYKTFYRLSLDIRERGVEAILKTWVGVDCHFAEEHKDED